MENQIPNQNLLTSKGIGVNVTVDNTDIILIGITIFSAVLGAVIISNLIKKLTE